MLEQVFREEWGRVLASLVGFLGDIELAEDAAQEAFATAAERWPRDGSPGQPDGLADHDRSQSRDRPHPARADTGGEDRAAEARAARRHRRKEAMDETATFPDERLELIFTCCHPALALDAQVGTHAAHARRPLDRGDRTRLPRPVRDDEQAPDTRQAQDPRRRHPVRRPARPPAARAARRRARGRLPDLQRRLGRRPRRPVGRSDPPRPLARRAHARRGRSARPARAHADQPRAQRRSLPRRRARPARRPGPVALGPAPDRARPATARTRAQPPRERGRLSHPGGDRRSPPRESHATGSGSRSSTSGSSRSRARRS